MFHADETDETLSFPKRIALYGDKINFSQKELTLVCGKSKSMIHRYCKGETQPSPETAELIFAYLDTKIFEKESGKDVTVEQRLMQRSYEDIIEEKEKRIAQKDEEIAAKNHRIEHLELVLAEVHKEKRAASLAFVICAIALALALIF